MSISLVPSIQTRIATINATPYPLTLFIRTASIPLRSSAKQLNIRKVVDTGMRKRVSTNKKMGAATCKKEKEVGATENPLAVSRS